MQPEADVETASVEAEKPAERAANGPPTADGLAANRAAHWHQDGNTLATIESVREWLQRSGLVLYAKREQLGAPAPSFVEATGDAAQSLLARLIASGAAVPLNLLGATGGMGTDVPDFVASAAVFSYIFTLRGNKAWKQPPATAGAVKVSPLALAVYEMLAAKVTLSAYDLATQLGKEVTEGAVLRALTELWSQLRVIPVPQPGQATLWELTSARFTKQIKAGANAGQPSALSALISLYLGQAMAATEDEIESFLSPLAPRSRVRDVIHALLSARQLETLVVKGKTLLHVAGDTPAFAAAKVEEVAASPEAEGGSRISKFASRPGSKIGTGLRSKPAFGSKPSFGKKPFGAKPAFGDRERRPFNKDARPARPSFDKPWNEDRKPRESFSPEPTHRDETAMNGAQGEAVDQPARREFPPRDSSSREGSGPRKTFSKPGTFGRKREGFGAKPSFDRGEGRPPRREFGSDSRPPRRDFGGDSRPPRREFGSDSRPPRRDFGSDSRPPRRDSGDRPAAGGFKRPGSYTPRPAGGERSGGFGAKPSFGGKPSFGSRRLASVCG